MNSCAALRRLGMTLGGLGVLCAPVCAQQRVYTNDDLGKPIVRTTTVTPDQLAALKAREYTLPPSYHGPIVIVVPSSREPYYSPAFPPFPPTAPLGSQGYYDAIAVPYFVRPYGSVSGFSQHYGHRALSPIAPPPPPRVVAPAIVIPAASAGARLR